MDDLKIRKQDGTNVEFQAVKSSMCLGVLTKIKDKEGKEIA